MLPTVLRAGQFRAIRHADFRASFPPKCCTSVASGSLSAQERCKIRATSLMKMCFASRGSPVRTRVAPLAWSLKTLGFQRFFFLHSIFHTHQSKQQNNAAGFGICQTCKSAHRQRTIFCRLWSVTAHTYNRTTIITASMVDYHTSASANDHSSPQYGRLPHPRITNRP